MTHLHTSIDTLIGATPLVLLERLACSQGAQARLLAKLEMLQPTGSAKARIARAMLDTAEVEGRLSPGGVIIEPTRSEERRVGKEC